MQKAAKNGLKYFIIMLAIVIIAFLTSLFSLGYFSDGDFHANAAYTSGDYTVEDVSGGVEIISYNQNATGTVTIPETLSGKKVVTISQTAFNGKTLSGVSIPKYVSKIGSYEHINTFDNCANLTTFTVAAGNDYYMSDSGVLYSKMNGAPYTLIRYPIKKAGTTYTVLANTKYIGGAAFAGNTIIVTVTLPAGLTHVGNYAFSGCNKITAINIPSSVVFVGDWAFLNASVLNSVTINAQEFYMGSYAFNGTQLFTSTTNNVFYSTDNGNRWILGRNGTLTGTFTVASNVKGIASNTFSGSTISGVAFAATPTIRTIGSGAFSGCPYLKSITIPPSVTNIGAYAFMGTSLNSLGFSGTTLKTIGDYAFANAIHYAALTNVPSSVTSIGAYAFSSNTSMTSFTMPTSLIHIGEGAFSGSTALTTFTIPTTVAKIEKNAFLNTKRFTDAANNAPVNINNWIVGSKGTITATTPSFASVIGIADYALEGKIVAANSTITLPSTVKYIGQYAFASSSGIATLNISGNVQYIEPYAFAGCQNIKSLTFNSGTKRIEEGAFKNSMNNGVTTNNLSVTIPTTVTDIDAEAFSGAIRLTGVIFQATPTLKSIGNYAFNGCSNLSSIAIPTSVDSIGRYAFDGSGIYNAATNNTIVYAGNWAVSYKGDKASATTAATVTFAASTRGIASCTLSNMTALTTVNIPEGPLYINSHAFYHNTSLSKIIIPASVQKLGDYAFYMCFSLTHVMITRNSTNGGQTAAGEGMFNNTPDTLGNYVLDTNVNTYKAMTNWNAVSSKISALANISVVSGAGGTVSNTSGYYFPNESISFTASPNTAYYFEGWENSSTIVSRFITHNYNTVAGTHVFNARFLGITTENISTTYSKTAVPASFTPAATFSTNVIYSPGGGSAPINVGSYNATIIVLNPNSQTVGAKEITIQITPKTLTITASAATKVYGSSDPPLNYSQVGLISGDSISGSQIRAAGDNVSTYAISQGNLSAGNNYTISYTGNTFTITEKALTITAAAKTKVYGDSDPAFTYTSSGLVGSDTISGTLSRLSGNTVGSYAITKGTLSAGNNYTISYTPANLTISRRPIGITAVAASKTYGQSDPASFTYTVTTGSFASGESSLSGSLSRATGENAGTYAINQGTITNANNGNYDIAFTSANFIINRASAVISGTTTQTFEYNKTTRNLSATLNHTETTISYSPSQGKTDVGTYPITASAAQTTNYNAASKEFTLIINNRTLTITANSASKVYGESDPVLSYSQTGLLSGDTITGAQTRATGENVNTYAITQGNLSAGNNYTISYTGNTFTITEKTLAITAAAKSKVYGDSDPAFTYTSSGLVGTDSINGSQTRDSGNNVGTYAINQGTLSAGNNYIISYTLANLTISNRPIGITAVAASKIYNQSDPASFTYTVTSGSYASGESSLSGSLSRATGENAGTYAIDQGTVTNANNGNYSITFTSANFIINRASAVISGTTTQTFEYNKATRNISASLNHTETTISYSPSQGKTDVGTYPITASAVQTTNYNATSKVFSLVINPKALTITANSASKVYGENDPTLAYLQVGLITGDTITGLQTRATGENVNTYAISQGTLSAGNNYTITYTGNTFTITTRAITVTADAKTKVYGDFDPALTYQVTLGNLVNGDTLSGALTRVSGENVNSYQINQGTITNANNTNYAITYVAANLAITRRPISITANQKTKIYGEGDPAFDYRVVSGSYGNADTILSGALSRIVGEDVNSFTITQGTITNPNNPNYNISYTSDILTITKKDLTIIADDKEIIYGDLPPIYTISYIGRVNGDIIAGEASSNYVQFNNANSYLIAVEELVFTNYNPTYVAGTLTVEKKAVTIKADNKSVVYGDSPPLYTISYTGLINSDTLVDIVSSDYAIYDNAGAYTITVQQKTYTNYSPTYQSGTLSVAKKAVTITAENKEVIYGDALPAFTFIYAGTVNNDILADTASTPYNRYDNVGEFLIEVTTKIYTNYAPIYVDGELKVNKRNLVIKADNMEIPYGSPKPEFTFSYENLVNDDELNDHAFTNYNQYDVVGTYSLGVVEQVYTNYIPEYRNGVLTVIRANSVISGDRTQIHIYDSEMKYILASLNHSEATLSYSPVQGYKNAGAYPITITSAQTQNYNAGEETFTLIINQKDITITAEPKSKIYGEIDPELTYIKTGMIEGEVLTGGLEREVGENVNEYTINIGSLSAGDNYDLIYVESVFTINQRPLEIAAHAKEKIYGDSDPVFTYSIILGNLVGEDELYGVLTREEGIYVGEYEILIGSLQNSNYAIDYTPEYLTINKRPITISANDLSKYYGEIDPEFTYRITAGSLAYDDAISAAVAREEGEDVGEYPISIVQSENNSYAISYQGNVFTINRRPITVSAHNKSKIYGFADPELTYYFSQGNLVYSEQLGIYDLTLVGDIIRQSGENKGVYTILQGTITNENNTNYDISYQSNDFEIEARPLTLSAHAKTKTYGYADPELTYNISEGSLGFSDELVGEIDRVEGENVDTYEIHQGSITNANNTNYEITFMVNDFVITRRLIEISATAFGKVYGYNDPSLPYAISGGSLAFTDILSGRLDREEGENIGSYDIYQGTLNNENNGNYDIIFIDNIFEITKRTITVNAERTTKIYGDADPYLTYYITGEGLAFEDVLNGSLYRAEGEIIGHYHISQGSIQNENNTNYYISFVSNIFEVAKRQITVSANEIEKIYGDEDPVLTYQIIEGNMAFEDELVGELEREVGENVNAYEINQGTITHTNNVNYDISFIEGVFTINRRPITITPHSQTKTYGYADPALFMYTISQGNLAYADSLNGALGRIEGELVGNYFITYGTLDNISNPNYDITLAIREFEIEKRPIVIISDAKSKIYGNDDPIFTYGILSGTIVSGDSLSGNLIRVAGENTGVYPIQLGTLDNPNYELIIISGNLIINPRPITISAVGMSFLHGSKSEIDLSYTISGNPLPQDEQEIASSIRISSARPNSVVGLYPINLNQILPLNNYNLTLVKADLNILPGTITGVFFEDKSVLYDGYEHSMTASGDINRFNIVYRNNAGIDVGVYQATAIVSKENYNDLTLNARLIVMTNRITTSEIIPQAIFTMEEGVDPYVLPVLRLNTDSDVLAQANEILSTSQQDREEVRSIVNISLYNNGEVIELSGSTEIKMLIPQGVNNLETLRIVHITDMLTYDVPFEIVGDYVIFTADELGDYAFITASEEEAKNEWIAQGLFYAGMGVLGLGLVAFIFSGFSGIRRKRGRGRFV